MKNNKFYENSRKKRQTDSNKINKPEKHVKNLHCKKRIVDNMDFLSGAAAHQISDEIKQK